MKHKLKPLVVGATALAAAGALVIGGAGVAFAATPPYEPDTANQFGTFNFYDASGHIITGGNLTDDPNYKYAVASSDDPIAANTKATLYGYLPKSGVASGAWTGEQLSGSTTFPNTTAPAPLNTTGTHRPVVTGATGDITFGQLATDLANTATDAYAGLYQLRIKTASNTKYWVMDIQVNTAAGTWTEVYPGISATSTTLSASPASPQTLNPAGSAPSAITLTATEAPAAAGTVQFFRNGTALGSPVAVDGSGVATTTDTPAGPTSTGGPVTTSYTATFNPDLGAAASGSSSSALAYVVQNKPGDTTATTLAVSQDGYAGDPVSFSSTVSDTAAAPNNGTPAGSVSWFDNGSSTPVAGPTPVNSSGVATASLPSGLASGPHSVVAVFTPTDGTLFSGSQSSASQFSLSAKSPTCVPRTDGLAGKDSCTNDSSFVATVDPGTLTISTPYTAANPFDLGHLSLDPSGTYLHTSAAFGTATAPQQGVTVVDTRAANANWTASVQAQDFASGANSISAANLGFTGVTPEYVSGNAQQHVTPNDVPNAGPATVYGPGTGGTAGLRGIPHQFAVTTAGGDGTAYVIGSMDLYAPSSTPAGLYTATVTFTVA